MIKHNIIILSGWGMPYMVWDQIYKLLSNNFNLAFVHWNDVDSLSSFKEKTKKIILERNFKSFSLLGWSLGSLVAQEIAHDMKSSIESIILIGGTSSFVQHKEDKYISAWNKRFLEKMKCDILNKDSESTLIKFNNNMFSKYEKEKSFDFQVLEHLKKHIKEVSAASLIAGLDYLIQTDLRHNLSNLELPILLIHGEMDIICPLEAGQYIKYNTENSDMIILKDAGHVPFFTHAIDCYNIIYNFMKENLQ
ncbi:MAG: alpha/beta fold hydrolase [Bacillota bacterium]|nr:alpha/beta fold hydrolase [Bacillota bacterium]